MIADARGDACYTLHLTVREDQAEKEEKSAERKENLEKIFAWLKEKKPESCGVVFREDLSVCVDLGDVSAFSD